MPTETSPDTLVPYKLTICGISELSGHVGAGVTHVVSILDPDHPEPPTLSSFPQAGRVLFRFDDIIRSEPGAAEPNRDHIDQILDCGRWLREQAADHVLVHCHAGISRSTAAAAIMLAHDNPGREQEAFDAIDRVRPRSWPNSLMVGLADDVLSRDGALLDAMRVHHARVARAFPDLADVLRSGMRAHEVPGLMAR